MLRRLGSRILVLGLALCLVIVGAPTTARADGPPTPSPRWGCQATGVRVGIYSEVVANRPFVPCSSDQGHVAHATVTVDGSPYKVDVNDPSVRTTTQMGPYADPSAVAHVADAAMGSPLSFEYSETIGVRAVSAYAGGNARTDCRAPMYWYGRSSVAEVHVVQPVTPATLGVHLYPGSEPMDVPIPNVGVLHLNWQHLTATEVIQRAVWLETANPATDVVVAEARAGCLPPTDGSPPTIGVVPAELRFSGYAGDPDPASQSLSIANTGGGTLSYSLSDDAPWLSITPTAGSAPSSSTVSVNTAGLPEGTYIAAITVTSPEATNSPMSVPVQLVLASGAPPTIAVDPTSLSFHGTAFDTRNPLNQSLFILNSGGRTLSYVLTSDAPWLRMTPVNGTAPRWTSVSVTSTGLPPGTYTAKIKVTSFEATNSPLTVPVTLVLTSPLP